MFDMARIVGYATIAIGLIGSLVFMNFDFLKEVSFATSFIGFGVYGIGIYEPEIENLREKFTKYIDRYYAVSYNYQNY